MKDNLSRFKAAIAVIKDVLIWTIIAGVLLFCVITFTAEEPSNIILKVVLTISGIAAWVYVLIELFSDEDTKPKEEK